MIRTRLKPTVRAAMQIALKTGVLRRCPHHWVYLRSNDPESLEHAFRLGNYLISHFAKNVACFKGDRKKLAEAILRCRDEADERCAFCG
jgi:hypothetical protein